MPTEFEAAMHDEDTSGVGGGWTHVGPRRGELMTCCCCSIIVIIIIFISYKQMISLQEIHAIFTGTINNIINYNPEVS
ncbi:unnamed protein product [Trichobilharzia regenti]|nr:unnamed protein product [Trichobilharzia regenti]